MPKFSIDTSSKYDKDITNLNKNINAQSTLNIETEIYEPPLITYYAKVVDNLTNLDITNYKNAMDNDFTWYYGKIHQDSGESQYMIQYDIWNNEPAFNHRSYEKQCKQANNIKFGISFNKVDMKKDEDYEDSLINIPFLYARIYNEDYINDWQPITLHSKIPLISNTTNDEGILYGNGDHCIVQTKLILPSTSLLPDRYYFHATISYTFD